MHDPKKTANSACQPHHWACFERVGSQLREADGCIDSILRDSDRLAAEQGGGVKIRSLKHRWRAFQRQATKVREAFLARVEFEVVKGRKGLQAANVTRLSPSENPT